MVRVPTHSAAAQRSRWLAEISEALEEAQALLGRLSVSELKRLDLLELSVRLEAARTEALALRIGRRDGTAQTDQEWINPLPWDRRGDDRDA
jgi:hypothetical protein